MVVNAIEFITRPKNCKNIIIVQILNAKQATQNQKNSKVMAQADCSVKPIIIGLYYSSISNDVIAYDASFLDSATSLCEFTPNMIIQ